MVSNSAKATSKPTPEPASPVSGVFFGLALLIVGVMSVVGAAHGQAVRSLLEMRREGVVVQQWDTSCGAAALATVFTYSFKDPVSERSVAQAMLRRTDPLRVKVRGGFSLLDMKRFAEARGYAAAGFRNVSFEELLGMHSPIVPIDEYGDAHFVVVRGLREGKVDIADPGFGNRTMSIERFSAAWRDGIAFVVRRETR